MIRIFNRRIRNIQALFSDHFIEVKTFYVVRFDRVPCITFIGELDITAALAFIRQKFEAETIGVFQHSYFDHEERKMFFNNTVLVLSGNKLIEVAGNYCQVLHTDHQYEWAFELVKELAKFRVAALAEEVPATVIGFARQTTLN